jgi:hypothetical protein
MGTIILTEPSLREKGARFHVSLAFNTTYEVHYGLFHIIEIGERGDIKSLPSSHIERVRRRLICKSFYDFGGRAFGKWLC